MGLQSRKPLSAHKIGFTMAHKIIKELNLSPIAEKLEKIKLLDKKGIASFSGGVPDYDELSTVILTSINIDEIIPETEKIRIVNRAIISAASKGKITEKSILGEINKEENLYLSLIQDDYIIVSSLSIKYSHELSRIFDGGITSTFSNYLPKKFNQSLVNEKLELKEIKSIPRTYTRVRIRTKGRSILEAGERALNFLDFIRGIWNFSVNLKTYSIKTYGNCEPINKIRLGPFHTIHKTTGKLSSDTFWYDKKYLENKNIRIKEKEFVKIKRDEKYIRKQFKKISYNKELENAFIRYANALDETEYEAMFLKLWSLLELLTNTLKRKYDVTICRAVFMYEEIIYHKQILEHLRNYRNQSVHMDIRSDQIEALVFQLKRYVERLFLFHINNAGSFTSFEEAGEFLDLSTDKVVLQKRIKLLNKALHFRNK